MRIVLTVILALFVGGSVRAQEPPVRPVDAIPHYVEYGIIPFPDEKAMLDHWASQFRLDPDNVIYIFAYSGRRACKGEAAAHAARAKNYLMKKHGIRADRIIWKDGGFRENLSVELWLRPRADTPPVAVPTVSPSEVEFIEGCKRMRGRRGKSQAAHNNGMHPTPNEPACYHQSPQGAGDAGRQAPSSMVTKISPWTGSVHSTSPDGKFTAAIDDAREVGQGAPTYGILNISNGMSYQRCNPSIVWSDDSQYLAVPQWTRKREQRLLVISLEQKFSGYAPGLFRVLELHSFLNGKIKGIDSPIYQPREIEIDVSQIQWE